MLGFAIRCSRQLAGQLSSKRPAVRVAAGAAGVLAVVGMMAAPAAMASSTTSTKYFWVAPTSTSTANTSCKTAAYTSVQAAINAAQAYRASHPTVVPTVEVCPGTYTGQLTITRSLVLTQAKGSHGAVVIELPATIGAGTSTGLSHTNCQVKDTSTEVPQSVIEICAAKKGGANTKDVSVSISGITVEGNWTSGSCGVQLYGVLVEGGASLSLSHSVVEKVENSPLDGCQVGVGIQAGFSPTGQVGHVTLTDDTVRSYQKNGITIDGSGSTAKISGITVTGAGPTSVIAQNGIQISFGATGSVTRSTITDNNYTGTGYADAAGILVFGGGGKVCGLGTISPLVLKASFTHNKLVNNDIGLDLANLNSACTESATVPTRDLVCDNSIRNTHGYPNGVASADANISGYQTAKGNDIGDQAGIADSGYKDVICGNSISGTGYASRDAASTLPNPAGPAWVRPIDLISFAPARHPVVSGNKYDGKAYKPTS